MQLLLILKNVRVAHITLLQTFRDLYEYIETAPTGWELRDDARQRQGKKEKKKEKGEEWEEMLG